MCSPLHLLLSAASITSSTVQPSQRTLPLRRAPKSEIDHRHYAASTLWRHLSPKLDNLQQFRLKLRRVLFQDIHYLLNYRIGFFGHGYS